MSVSGALADDNQNYYAMDNLTGNLNDSSSNGNTLTNAGGATINESGKLNQSYFFDGNNDYLTANVLALGSGDFSFNYWLYLDIDNSDPMIFRQEGTHRVQMFINGLSNDLRWNVVGSSATIDRTITSTPLLSDTFQMITLVRTGNNFSVYINNTLVDTVISAVGSVVPTGNLHLGARAGPMNYFTGKIDEFSYWNKSLSSTERTNLYNSDVGFNFYSDITPTDSCTPPAINNNWDINMTDACIINDAIDLGTGNITFSGSSGNATFNTSINISKLDFPTSNTILYITSNAEVLIG